MPQRDIERLGGDVVHREKRRAVLESGFDWRDDGGVQEAGGGHAAERVGQTRDLLGHDIEAKCFDGDQPIVIGTLYVHKWAVKRLADPRTITVTIAPA